MERAVPKRSLLALATKRTLLALAGEPTPLALAAEPTLLALLALAGELTLLVLVAHWWRSGATPTTLVALLATRGTTVSILRATALATATATAETSLALRVAELLVAHSRVRATADVAAANPKATTPGRLAATPWTTLRPAEPIAASLRAVDLRQQASATILLRCGNQVLQHVVELEVRVGGTVRHHKRH